MILSVITLLVVLLIAYWWGNAGVFDALLHLLYLTIAARLATWRIIPASSCVSLQTHVCCVVSKRACTLRA